MSYFVNSEMFIDGAWTDVTSRTRGEDKVVIQRGQLNEQGSSVTPSTCNFTLNNRDGLYSNRNPNSQYFGLLGRNIPFRTGIRDDSGVSFWARAYGQSNDYLQTSDKSSLDITGDIDIRIDVYPERLGPSGRFGSILAAKYDNSATQRSWIFLLRPDGKLMIVWSNDGTDPTGGTTYATSTAAPNFSSGRLALRVGIDTNNGSGGRTIAFYTAPTIGGTYTQLGSSVVQTGGTTSIFSSTAPVQVGGAINSAGAQPFSAVVGIVGGALRGFRGRIYSFEIRNAISGGTLVAQANANGQTSGTSSWSDGLTSPNTWTINVGSTTPGVGTLTRYDWRMYGEVSEFPQKWDVTGRDVYIPTVASGILRRLTQGAKALRSPVYRNLLQYSPTGYWPLEDGDDTTAAGSATAAARPALINDITFGSATDFPGSSGCATINSTSSYILATAGKFADTGDCNFIAYVKCSGTPTTLTFFDIYHSGTLPKWRLGATATTLTVQGFDDTGAQIVSGSALWSGSIDPTKWFGVNLELIQSGGNISYAFNVHQVGSTSFFVFGSGTTAGTVGHFTQATVTNNGGGQTGYQFAHMFINQKTASFVTSNFAKSSNAFLGETAGNRATRLGTEEGIQVFVEGGLGESELMGYQTPNTVVNLLQECVDVDGGFLTETRASLGIRVWLRNALINQLPVDYDYSAAQLYGELLPVDDDQILRNDITISRPNGGQARAVQSSGPNNVNDPTDDPQGVGTYSTSYSLNTSDDARLQALAEYAKFLGTWDGLRYPTVSVHITRTEVASDTVLTESTKRLDVGSVITLTDLPTWLPPDDTDLLIRGGTETYDQFQWIFKWNTQPYGPYQVNDLSTASRSRYRLAATASATNASINTTATSFAVKTPIGKLWIRSATKPGSFPIDVIIAGERMTVGAISGTSSPQTFSSVTRSVNGIVKSHSANEPVQVAEPFYTNL